MPISIEDGESTVSIKAHLDKAIEDFENGTLHPNVNIVGIVGMAGSGKTFLAKELYNRKSLLFSGSSFLLDVNKAAEECGLHKLQKRMLKDLHVDVSTFNNTSKCKRAIAHRLKHHQLFIVLDSIDDVDQLEALLPEKDAGSGSMVIVTTRDVGILKSYGISSIYTMKRLSPAKELFCQHAFSQSCPIKGFEYLVDKLSSACGGLPLSLEESLLDRIGLTNISVKKPIIRILVANGDSLKGEKSKLTKDLVWLRWRDCAYQSIPPSVSIENMRVLKSCFVHFRAFSLRQPTHLRELVILGSIGIYRAVARATKDSGGWLSEHKLGSFTRRVLSSTVIGTPYSAVV
ncbi:hypothetical protein SUGI_0689150 [Cryptomeria japonica]|nr:hypothetical protein SUGI_0689150 [Cryptomeria japonica]